MLLDCGQRDAFNLLLKQVKVSNMPEKLKTIQREYGTVTRAGQFWAENKILNNFIVKATKKKVFKKNIANTFPYWESNTASDQTKMKTILTKKNYNTIADRIAVCEKTDAGMLKKKKLH